MVTKPSPAISFSGIALSHRSAAKPNRIAMPVDAARAEQAAANTNHLFRSPSDANKIVANCVLSPSSAKKTVRKIVRKAVICDPVFDE
tara:strand:- start:313 stop:576 length:264 start_codon:yes stop_codon:yes gene_type:complete